MQDPSLFKGALTVSVLLERMAKKCGPDVQSKFYELFYLNCAKDRAAHNEMINAILLTFETKGYDHPSAVFLYNYLIEARKFSPDNYEETIEYAKKNGIAETVERLQGDKEEIEVPTPCVWKDRYKRPK